MRSEKLYDALTEVDGALIDEAAAPPEKQKKKRALRLRWLGAVAAVLAAAILLTVVLRPGGDGGLTAYALETPVYPASAPYPDASGLMSGETVDEEAFEAAWNAWSEVRQKRWEARQNYSADQLRGYLAAAIPAFLGGHEGENASCSPTNLYLALAMLAETTGGETREQILSLLGAADMDSLRTLATNLFVANYNDDGATKSLLAGAIWLRDDLDYNAETLKRLAETYYAASFRGEMGSEDYDKLLRQWLNEQTGNQLADQIGGLSFDPETVLALTAAVDFSDQWYLEFDPGRTDDGVFHAVSGDLACRMMHQDIDSAGFYFWGEQFGAVTLSFKEGGQVRFLLPDEGVTPEALLQDPEALSFLLTTNSWNWENSKNLIIHLSVPKFDISSQLSLEGALQGLGLTDAFDRGKADFSPLTDTEGVYLSEVKHGTRIAADEKGVTASAYTIIPAPGAAPPPEEEIDFTLDRPFLFAVCGSDGLPLFVGIVNQP
jgi:serpin B